jgi:hypothetical protein
MLPMPALQHLHYVSNRYAVLLIVRVHPEILHNQGLPDDVGVALGSANSCCRKVRMTTNFGNRSVLDRNIRIETA